MYDSYVNFLLTWQLEQAMCQIIRVHVSACVWSCVATFRYHMRMSKKFIRCCFFIFSSCSDMWHHRNYATYYSVSYQQLINKLCGNLYFFLYQSILRFALFIESHRIFRGKFIFRSSSSNLLSIYLAICIIFGSSFSNICIVKHKNICKVSQQPGIYTQLSSPFLYFYFFQHGKEK